MVLARLSALRPFTKPRTLWAHANFEVGGSPQCFSSIPALHCCCCCCRCTSATRLHWLGRRMPVPAPGPSEPLSSHTLVLGWASCQLGGGRDCRGQGNTNAFLSVFFAGFFVFFGAFLRRFFFIFPGNFLNIKIC